jgi:hypothetical protein
VFWLLGFIFFGPAMALAFRVSLEQTLEILLPIGATVFAIILVVVAVRSFFR